MAAPNLQREVQVASRFFSAALLVLSFRWVDNTSTSLSAPRCLNEN
jgi:hypothetical protein